MPLDDHEQQILAEIERRFYEEDPDLVHAVKNIDRGARYGVRLPAIGAVVGATMVMLSFTLNTLAALLGFILLVVSTTMLVQGIRTRPSVARSQIDRDVAPRFPWRFRRG